jgi:hypothetical protein
MVGAAMGHSSPPFCVREVSEKGPGLVRPRLPATGEDAIFGHTLRYGGRLNLGALVARAGNYLRAPSRRQEAHLQGPALTRLLALECQGGARPTTGDPAVDESLTSVQGCRARRSRRRCRGAGPTQTEFNKLNDSQVCLRPGKDRGKGH